MSLESVRDYFAQHAPDIGIIEQSASTATVAEAAETLGVLPGQIAKTLSVRVGDTVMLIVARGDARLDNRKTKDALGGRPRMLGGEEVEALPPTSSPLPPVPPRPSERSSPSSTVNLPVWLSESPPPMSLLST